MWQKITLMNDATRVDEIIEGDIEHAKLLLALQHHGFEGIRDMYLMDLDEEPQGRVKIYHIGITHDRKIEFIPFTFHPGAFGGFTDAVNVTAMSDHRAARKFGEFIDVFKDLNLSGTTTSG